MTVRVEVPAALFQWARARSGIGDDVWGSRFPRFDSWVSGETCPTLKQLEEFARKTHTPVGFFFLDEPPAEQVPIPDFRTVGDHPVGRPVTADLLDTLYVCQARQEWYRDSQLLNGEAPLDFVGSATVETPSAEIAASIAEQLAWGYQRHQPSHSSEDALTALRESAEAAGVLVMISGIVGSNTHRKLDPAEFRGFALADPHAALVFVNGADAKAAQLFTLAHELAHLWLGSTGLSDVNPASAQRFDEERWCNQVAAELLVPMAEFMSVFDTAGEVRQQLRPLAERFGVSSQVILARMRECGTLSWEEFMAELHLERERVAAIVPRSGGGGDFHKTKPVQVGKRFARELITSTLEGRTTYTEAFHLLGVKKTSTFEGLGQQLSFPIQSR